MPEYKQSQPEEQSQHIKQSNWIYARWVLLRLILVCYDILVINGAVYLAMITRFYVAKEMHSAGVYYFSVYPKYALVYTVACVFVFRIFRLYSGIWKYAGLNDLNWILLANLTTFVGHVAGTILFHIRMPISVYCISAVIQLVLITMSRFSYRPQRDQTAGAGEYCSACLYAEL